MADYVYSMETRLTPDQQRGVNLIQDIARRAGLNLYLTGGTIRDLVTGFPIRDIDLSVQGNPLKLQKELEKAGISVEGVDESLRSLHLLMPGNVRAELNLTRSEVYDKPGKPPAIIPATINEDLRRRDFTVNAMALSLNEGSRGLLLDPFNGVADIEAKVLRVLHNYAFLEDPIRLVRASRLGARFHWPLEERTQARYDAARENNYIEYVDKRSVGAELEQMAHEDDPISVMRALEKDGWLKVLHPHLSVAKAEAGELGHAIKLRQALNDLGYSVETGPITMYFLTRKMSDKDVSEIQRMVPRRDFVSKWKHLEHDAQDLAKRLSGKEATTNSGAWKLLSATAPERILFLTLTTRNSAVEQKLHNFMTKWRQVRERLPFPEMAEMRITAQLPEYAKILDEAFLLLLDGKLRSHGEIVNFLTPYEPPPPPPPPAPKRGRGKAVVAEVVPAAVPAAPAAPAKRGRKPKGAVAGTPAAVAKVPAEVPPPVAADKAAAPAKSKVETKKAVPAKVAAKATPLKKAAPAKPAKHAAKNAAKNAAPKKAAPAKKKSVAAKKPPAKKPAVKKTAKKKR
ncbi:MAG TPA: CCA tRNA nucleotidyltransferase [Candidatus Angelobacter sp.]|nr:CCA tRNA nucleotidyltransferase [Candidatus Angelobacter sp.]